MFQRLILSSLLGEDLAALFQNISTKNNNTVFPRHHKKLRVVLFRCPRSPFLGQKLEIAVVRICLPPETSVYSSFSIYARDYRIICQILPSPAAFPKHLNPILGRACNSTPTVLSTVYYFSNTRRPAYLIESYPAASSQTSITTP